MNKYDSLKFKTVSMEDTRLSKVSDLELIVVTEELSELTKAIQKLQRYRLNDKLLRVNIDEIRANIKEEIADVKIVLDNLIDKVFENDLEYYKFVVYKMGVTEKLLKEDINK